MDAITTSELWESKLKEFIRVNVNYYDEAHGQALQGYPNISAIEKVVSKPVEIPVDEFLTHFLFHRARTGSSRFAGYSATRRMIATACGMLQHLIKLESGALMLDEAHKLPREITEHIGESVALSIMNRIHGLM